MTPNEFKAWFDGFTEAFEGRIPTKAQWGRIKERVAEIDGKPVTERVYVDRYWPTYIKTYPSGPYWASYCTGISNSTLTTSNAVLLNAASLPQNVSKPIGSGGTAFNSLHAMNELGRADAAALGAQ